MAFLLRALATAFGLWVASNIVPGVRVDDWVTLALAAVLLGVINAVVRPVLVILRIPLLILTLGLFLLVINALLLWLVAAFLPGFHVQDLASALVGAVVVSLCSWLAALVLRPGRKRSGS